MTFMKELHCGIFDWNIQRRKTTTEVFQESAQKIVEERHGIINRNCSKMNSFRLQLRRATCLVPSMKISAKNLPFALTFLQQGTCLFTAYNDPIFLKVHNKHFYIFTKIIDSAQKAPCFLPGARSVVDFLKSKSHNERSRGQLWILIFAASNSYLPGRRVTSIT